VFSSFIQANDSADDSPIDDLVDYTSRWAELAAPMPRSVDVQDIVRTLLNVVKAD
jgi:hypothetical protein